MDLAGVERGREPAGEAADFPMGIFRARRERVLSELGEGAMVLPAGPVLRRPGGTELRYRPDSELFYLTGMTEPEALLVLRGFADEERAVLFVRPRDEKEELWNGPRIGPEGAEERFQVDAARPATRIAEELPELLDGADRIHFRIGAHTGVEAAIGEALVRSRRRGAREGTGPRGLLDPGGILDELRLRKDPSEIEAIRAAVEITMAGFRTGLARTGPGVGEWEVESVLEGEFRRLGGSGSAFPPIVGSGPNACTLHYIANARRMNAGELLLVDAGAEYRMYGGDITRTVPVSGRFSSEQRDVYSIVDAARAAAVASIRPGTSLTSIHEEVCGIIVRGLLELGMLSGEADELVSSSAHRPWLPHSTSHWLGLDTHDVGDYMRNGTPRPLEPGMVLTVEPGLYFPPGSGLPFQGIGIRIEEDVLVTEAGAEVLSQSLPTGLEQVEALVGVGES